jgi:hypothetical protein
MRTLILAFAPPCKQFDRPGSGLDGVSLNGKAVSGEHYSLTERV